MNTNNLTLFDTHTHYDDEQYNSDRDSVIENMLSSNVAGFMAIGCSLSRSQKAVNLASAYDNVYAAVGIHPGDIEGLPIDYLSQLKKMAANKKVAAIGEIGLDYFYEGYDKERQQEVFIEQLALATELNLPVIIHSREATQDTLDVIKKHLKTKAVMHCFSGSVETAQILIKMGIMISFTGVLTFKNAKKAIEALRAVPLNMLMLETDCPYMAPTPFRGNRCDSSMTWYTAQKIAEIKQTTTDKIVETCNNNAKRFFNINF